MLYSLDTSALLDGWVRYYPPATFGTLWQNIEGLIANGDLRAVDEVFQELSKQGDDAVVQWCKSQDDFLINLDESIQLKVAEILTTHPNLVDSGKGRSGADPFVIALAENHACAVVTAEVATNKSSKPRIPDVCKDRHVRCITLLQMIQEQNWRF